MTLDSIKIAFLDSTEALFSASKNWDGLLALWEIDLRSSDDPELLAELVQRMVRICRDTGRDERSAQIITFGEQRLAGQRGHLPVATRDLAAETDSGEYVRRLAGQSARSAPSSPPTASASRADLSASPTTHSRPAAP
ncbi:MAG: hypothetical protein KC609_16625, partial [Myxococcales bacterium]|nr:hypothetical protein [Myxococcales bacterium]